MENKHLNEALNEAGKLIKSKLRVSAVNDGFKATGKLDKSFDYSVVANELKVMSEKYAGALSEGISTNGSGDKAEFEKMQINIIKWAKIKGIRPQVRDKKGRFQKVTDRTWKSLGFVLSRSIRKKGISKRFGYKGSGFIQEVKTSMEKKITDIITEGYKKDLLEQINK
jgi:folate-dependent tRNA-U54 methylase TrmFO/GidA